MIAWDQLGIALFGVTAIWLSQDAREGVRRFACIFGLVGQPFWFYATYVGEQWGMFALCFLYSWAWGKGFRQHWLRRMPPALTAQQKALETIAQVSPSIHANRTGDRRCTMCEVLINEARSALGKPAWSEDQKAP
jgi:hypothetical protein